MFDRAIQKYFADKQSYAEQQVSTEGSVRRAFGNLLQETARTQKWTLIEEHTIKKGSRKIRVDGVLRDAWQLPYGYWEAKDSRDDLQKEITNKILAGYPTSNIIFEDTRQAVLYQHQKPAYTADLSDPKQIAELLDLFYKYSQPDFQGFEAAVLDFQARIPDLGERLKRLLAEAHGSSDTGLQPGAAAPHPAAPARRGNPKFQAAYAKFFQLCKDSLNPNISREAVDEMLIQHLMTERLMESVFNNPDFARRNVIAAEVEKVIDALTSQHFHRREFFKDVERFYVAIENAARTLNSFAEKQHFINTVYERFFQGYSVKVADTHGIVYTPQEIVDFMGAAVEEVLHTEFGLNIYDDEVVILDPCTGTGNFIINLMNRIPKHQLEKVYKNQLFANEVMLLPYYVASLNIEHEYYELMGTYEPFEGLCFVDTLDMAEGAQMKMAFMTEKNTERVERQKKAAITVIIGNPPYNVGQLNENDNNKNRAYEEVDKRVRETYAKDSKATLKNKLYDPYVKFFRWATDRLNGSDGIVCFVSNNSFIDQIAFDGMRKHLLQDFTRIYHVDLHGNVRQNPGLSGSTHNVFGIQIGVGITVAVRNSTHAESKLFYHRVPEFWTRREKLAWLSKQVETNGRHNSLNTIENLREHIPDTGHTWIIPDNSEEFTDFIPLGTDDTKSELKQFDGEKTIFRLFSLGVATNRDDWVYNFSKGNLVEVIEHLIKNYNYEVFRLSQEKQRPETIDSFVNNDAAFIKWTDRLKKALENLQTLHFEPEQVRSAVYRPFTKKYLYFDHLLNQRRYQQHRIFPTPVTEQENKIIWIKTGRDWPMFALIADRIVDLLPQGGSQCFPFYVYDELPTNNQQLTTNHQKLFTRRENITDWALNQFRTHYNDDTITKWDIFYYVYGLLHHPGYRERYADNLKRELPRIPFAPDFWAFSRAGKSLADLHLNYESAPEYPLTWHENKSLLPTFRVTKMRLKNTSDSVGAGTGALTNLDIQRPVDAPDSRPASPLTSDSVGTPYMASVAHASSPDMSVTRPYKTCDTLIVNNYLTLRGIPPQTFDYRLGNRSALEWIVDQYQVKTDERSGIVSDPNNPDDERYIVRLVAQVITVSLETVKIVNTLPADFR